MGGVDPARRGAGVDTGQECSQGEGRWQHDPSDSLLRRGRGWLRRHEKNRTSTRSQLRRGWGLGETSVSRLERGYGGHTNKACDFHVTLLTASCRRTRGAAGFDHCSNTLPSSCLPHSTMAWDLALLWTLPYYVLWLLQPLLLRLCPLPQYSCI